MLRDGYYYYFCGVLKMKNLKWIGIRKMIPSWDGIGDNFFCSLEVGADFATEDLEFQ